MTPPKQAEPMLSDDELDAMRQADNGALNFVTLRQFRVIARAVEARVRAAQAEASTPVAYRVLLSNAKHVLCRGLPSERDKAEIEQCGFTFELLYASPPDHTSAMRQALNALLMSDRCDDDCKCSRKLAIAALRASLGEG